MFDPRTQGEQLWATLQAALPPSRILTTMCGAVRVRRFDGTLLELTASPLVSEFLRDQCSIALKEARNQVCPDVKLRIVASEDR